MLRAPSVPSKLIDITFAVIKICFKKHCPYAETQQNPPRSGIVQLFCDGITLKNVLFNPWFPLHWQSTLCCKPPAQTAGPEVPKVAQTWKVGERLVPLPRLIPHSPQSRSSLGDSCYGLSSPIFSNFQMWLFEYNNLQIGFTSVNLVKLGLESV